jgi:hypothetical protein
MSKTDNFIVFSRGPHGLFGVFEDEGDTGYLYVYDSVAGRVENHLHVYDRSDSLNVKKDDVSVHWSKQLDKCAVAIWNSIRGIIDVRNNTTGVAKFETRLSPGANDPKWLEGFEHLFE